MNKERLLAVADAIENDSIPYLKFNMGYVFHKFNEKDEYTHACIAGYALAMFATPEAQMGNDIIIAETVLGIDSNKYRKSNGLNVLFFPVCGMPYQGMLKEHAAATIRHFVETGEVDWSLYATKVEA